MDLLTPTAIVADLPGLEDIIYRLINERDPQTQAFVYDPRRLSRGADLLGRGDYRRLPDGRWAVVASDGQSEYLVESRGHSCNCPDAQMNGQFCKHRCLAVLLFEMEKRDAETDAEQADSDAYYCVLCEEPIPAAEMVETRWGFMHERCAASEPPADAAPITVLAPPADAGWRAMFEETFGGDAA